MPTSPAALISAAKSGSRGSRVGDAERPVAAAKAVVAVAVVAFHAPEEGQDVLVAPALVAHLRPGVEVLRLAAHEGHAVDGAGAAQQPAARHREAAAVGIGLGLRGVEPVGLGIGQQAGIADRDVRPGMARRDRLPAAGPGCVRPPTAGWRRPRRPIRRRPRCSRRFASSFKSRTIYRLATSGVSRLHRTSARQKLTHLTLRSGPAGRVSKGGASLAVAHASRRPLRGLLSMRLSL